jgi:serine/threonine protein kinase
MIDEEYRYFAPGGFVAPGGPSTWHMLDWDQRRIIAVTMDEEQEDEEAAILHLSKCIDTLEPSVSAVHLTQDGALLSTSTNRSENEMTDVWYPSVDELGLPARMKTRVKTILRSALKEVDRLTLNVDLVSYNIGSNGEEIKIAVFKYYFIRQFLHRFWHEMNILMRLLPHPNILPPDRLVLDAPHGRVVGFTTPYISGGTLDTDNSRTFKLKWLQQLTRVVDDLNLKHGIMHQDIAARNLLIDPRTDALVLFDFNYAARIGHIGYVKDREDIKGVIFTMYEIITHDEHFREVPYANQHYEDVQELSEWVKHPEVLLDHPVSEYRDFLKKWLRRRNKGTKVTIYKEASKPVDWPALVETGDGDIVVSHNSRKPPAVGAGSRHDVTDGNGTTIDWARPPSRKPT